MSTALEVCCGGVGSAVAGFVTNPLDIMRTRMQVQGDLCKTGEFVKHYHNIPQGIARVVREEGVLALQKGLGAAVIWQFIQNGLRIGLYPSLQQGWTHVFEEGHAIAHRLAGKGNIPRGGGGGGDGVKHITTTPLSTVTTGSRTTLSPPSRMEASSSGVRSTSSSSPLPSTPHKAGKPNMLVCLASGACSGAIGSFCASPFILVKTRLQSQRGHASAAEHLERIQKGSAMATGGSETAAAAALKKATGNQHGYQGMGHAFRAIYASGGIRALWHGSRTAMKRTMVGSSVQLMSYDYASQLLLWYGEYRARQCPSTSSSWSPTDPRVHCTAALLSSFVVVLFMNPFEVVMTRTYNHTIGNENYGGTIRSALAKVYRTEGVRGLYKGWGPMLGRFAPHTVVSFVVYEFLRARVGLAPSIAAAKKVEKA